LNIPGPAEIDSQMSSWYSVRDVWVKYLGFFGSQRLVLFPGDAKRLAALLSEAEPPPNRISEIMRAYQASITDQTINPLPAAYQAGLFNRFRFTLAHWLCLIIAP
jgi:hypothetical protein